MIKVILRGGLGNQMFEYAAGLNLALKNKTRLVLDAAYLNDRFPRPQFTYRSYDLDVFDIQPEFTALSKISSVVPIPGVWLGFDLLGLGFDILINALGKDPSRVALWGFYQGEKYFIENKEAVRAAFRFKYPLTGEAKTLAEKIQSCNSVSLHVRRGDYTLLKYAKHYGVTDLSYYDRAVRYIIERVPDAHLFVISDDPAWSAQNLRFAAIPTTYLDAASAGPKNAFHLELMSLCKHTIITNSSFSWWGAWLNRNPGKIIVAPKRWRAGCEGNENGIVPESWVRL